VWFATYAAWRILVLAKATEDFFRLAANPPSFASDTGSTNEIQRCCQEIFEKYFLSLGRSAE
jgi:hypothetical protein